MRPWLVEWLYAVSKDVLQVAMFPAGRFLFVWTRRGINTITKADRAHQRDSGASCLAGLRVRLNFSETTSCPERLGFGSVAPMICSEDETAEVS